MNKTNFPKLFIILSAVMFAGVLSAQVTIGSSEAPQSFSVIELISGNNKGLRLPQLTTQQRDDLNLGSLTGDEAAKAQGLQIFNTTTYCVETWNGAKWISSCAMCGDAPCVPPAAPTAGDQSLCTGKTVGDLVASGEVGATLKWYDEASGGTALAPSAALTAGSYYVAQVNSYGYESARTPVQVTLSGVCSQSIPNTVTSTGTLSAPLCLECLGKILSLTASSVTNPVFRVYDTQTDLTPLFTGNNFEISNDFLDITGDIQGNYRTVYVSVSGDNYLENLVSNRKEITIAGAKLPVFADYNLGADVAGLNALIDGTIIKSPAKAAMKYLADTTYLSYANQQTDGHVYGGRFQWGRYWDKTSNTTSYPISLDNNFTLYSPGTRAANMSSYTADNYESNGQVKSSDSNYGNHLYAVAAANSSDWTMPKTNNNLWGNGVEWNVSTASLTPNSGIHYNGDWYQSQKWNTTNNMAFNPCPSGWRVPTEDEWERVANYECNPASSVGFNATITGTNTKGFAWIPVLCSSGECFPDNSWTASINKKTGYAVYRYSDWSAYVGGDLLTFDKEPLLFLPIAGYRSFSSNTISYVGVNSYYWNSMPSSTNANGCNLSLNSNGVNPGNNSPRALGSSVRCVADSY